MEKLTSEETAFETFKRINDSITVNDPSRRQQANFLRKKLEGEKFEKSESEEV